MPPLIPPFGLPGLKSIYNTAITIIIITINIIIPTKFAVILIIIAIVLLILRYAKDENANAERAIYAIMSALFLFVGWYFYVFPLVINTTSQALAYSCNSIGCNTYPTTNTITTTIAYKSAIPISSYGFILSLTIVIFYMILMILFMVRDVIILRSGLKA